MILVNITYQVVTPESAEHGEDAESGFVTENAEYGFRELVKRLREEFTNPSCYLYKRLCTLGLPLIQMAMQSIMTLAQNRSTTAETIQPEKRSIGQKQSKRLADK
jgi:hypothetical protein